MRMTVYAATLVSQGRADSCGSNTQDHVTHPFATGNALRRGDFIDQPRFVFCQLEAARGVTEDRFTGRLLCAVCWSKERHFDSSGPVYLRIPALAYFLLFVEVYVGIPARPYEGWSVEIHPVRSTAPVLPRM